MTFGGKCLSLTLVHFWRSQGRVKRPGDLRRELVVTITQHPSKVMTNCFEPGTMQHCLSIRRRSLLLTTACASFYSFLPLAVGQEAAEADPPPLHQRVDQRIESLHPGPFSPPAEDGSFLRRTYLDLTGSLPPVAVTRQFLADPSTDKRTALVDRLIASPEFVRYMAVRLDVMLLERRNGNAVDENAWRQYLYDSVAEDMPLNELASELLAADGAEEAKRPVAKFLLDRQCEPVVLTRDVGRIFFGKDLQCAQCHDHPLISDYLQSDFFGLTAFLQRTYQITDEKNEKQLIVAEKGVGWPKYRSVFEPDTDEQAAIAKVPGGITVEIPRFVEADAYEVAPTDGVRGVPKTSLRKLLAEQLRDGNPMFARNLANRLWAQLMGRGLVEPLDMHHAENPATYPKLLELLASELVAMKFRLRPFLRELALTSAYARSIDGPAIDATSIDAPQLGEARVDEELAETRQSLQRLEEQKAELKPTFIDARDRLRDARRVSANLQMELISSQEQVSAAESKAAAATAAIERANQQVAEIQPIHDSLAVAAAAASSAADKSTEDEELRAIATALQEQLDKVAGRIASPTEEIAKQQAAVGEAHGELAKAKQQVEAIQTQLVSSAESIGTFQAAFERLKPGWDDLRQSFETLTARQTDLELKAEYNQSMVEVVAAEKSLADSQGAVNLVQASLESRQSALDQLVMQVTKAEEERTQIDDQLQPALRQFEKTRALLDALETADSALASAQQQLEEDEQLTSARDKIATAKSPINEELSRYRSSVVMLQSQAEELDTQRLALSAQLDVMRPEVDALTVEVARAERLYQEAQNRAAQTTAAHQTVSDRLVRRWSERHAIYNPRPLDAEQLAWSMMLASGQQERARDEVVTKWDSENPPPAEETPEAESYDSLREAGIEQQYFQKLVSMAGEFASLFAPGAGQPQDLFSATPDQALFLSNANVVKQWLAPVDGNLADRLVKSSSVEQLSDELFLAVLARQPSTEELSQVRQYLDQFPDERVTAIQDLIWSLMASVEFRFYR